MFDPDLLHRLDQFLAEGYAVERVRRELLGRWWWLRPFRAARFTQLARDLRDSRARARERIGIRTLRGRDADLATLEPPSPARASPV